MKTKPTYKWWTKRKRGRRPTPAKLKSLLEKEYKRLRRHADKPTQALVWDYDKGEWVLVKL